MRKILYYLIPCLLLIGVESCKDEDVSSPSAPTFTVDKTTGLYKATEFTFVVDQVGANQISLLPYGVEHPSFGGVSIPASSFINGKATVKFTYAQVGTFNAVAVSNNHSTDGTSIKNTYSDAKSVTITSDQASITSFSLATADKKTSTKTTIDQTAKTIAVTVPFGINTSSLKAIFAASALSTVTVGSTVQKSDTTFNNFTTPVTYAVKAQNGTTVNSYLVTVTVTPVEQLTTFKSFEGTTTKVLGTSIDNPGKKIVVYDTIGTASSKFGAVAVKFELNGKFAVAKYAGKKLAQGAKLDLTSTKQITVNSQDSISGTNATYDVYAVAAPKLTLAFNDLNPTVTGKPTNFAIAMNVLNGTTVAAIKTTAVTAAPAGVTVNSMTATGKNTDGTAYSIVFVSGDNVDYTKVSKIELNVTDANIGVTYTVVYSVSVTVLK